MLRWAALVIALSACKQEKPLGREIHVPPVEPTPVRVQLGECARSSDEFVSGEAPPTPAYWFEVEGEWPSLGFGGEGIGRFGTIGHGSGIGRGGMSGRYLPTPLTMLGQVEITGADVQKWKPITRRYVKRNIAKITYCYEKELLGRGDLAGTFVASMTIDKAGKVRATVTETFDAKVGTCIKGVLDSIELPKPDGPYTATLPITFAPSAEVRDQQRDAEADATAVGARHPLTGREDEIARCLRARPAPPGAGVIDWQFGLDGKPTTVALVGAENECIKRLATTVTNTSRAKNLRCAFVTGDAPPGGLLTFGILPDGMMRFDGNPFELYQLRTKTGDAIKYHSSSWASAITRGPLALAPGPTVPMNIVKKVIEEAHNENIATVFVVPHVFGGTRFLGARVPLPMEPKGRTHSDPLHVVYVHRIGVDVDDLPIASAADLMRTLERMRREDGTAVQIRFDMDATFGDFAEVVDMAVQAGLTDWQL
jgi:biopolymer transport protein ExbD